MKTSFISPQESVKMTIRDHVIGPGERGAMSAALTRLEPLFDSGGGFATLPRVTMTPQFFSGFLKRAGASHDNPKAEDAIRSARFNRTESDAVREALEQFKGLYVEIRADECTALRSGLWARKYAYYNNWGDSIDEILDMVKKVLESEFSRDAIAFKRRMGLLMGDTAGVMFMPVDVMPCLGTMQTTPLHAVATTGFAKDEPLVMIGSGIMGADKRDATVMLGSELDERHINDLARQARNRHALSLESKSILLRDKEEYAEVQEAVARFLAHPGRALSRLKRGLDALRCSVPMQLELAYSGVQWSVSRIKPAEFTHIAKPEHCGSIVSMEGGAGREPGTQYGIGVSGRKVVDSDTVFPVRCSEKGRKALAEFNAQADGYVLLLDAPLYKLRTSFSFADYSNAAAVLCREEPCGRSAMPQVGGALREAGIIVLASSMNNDFLSGLELGDEFLNGLRFMRPNEVKMRVYVNDEVPEGWASLR